MTVAGDSSNRGSSHGNNVALEDRFEVLKEIGDGSFGSVVLARVRTAGANVARRGTVVAIKSMKKTFGSFSQCLELREVVFLRTLPANPHLVPALDIFLDPYTKKLHIAMEYMEGNLYQLMKARDHKCLDNASVKSILFQIMQGLEHIHAHHFFHRDIKPENILVSTSSYNEPSTAFRRYSALVTPPSTPPTYTVKLADFGLARETHSKLPYTTYVSTRWYRAPEVLLRAGEYSAPVDIWAVGAMAVEVATLKPLFPGGNEVDQVWRVCEIMGSPGNWYSKSGSRVGGGDWREGTRLAGKLGFSFPKMAPHSMETILQAPQWPRELAHFVTWCLLWDPKNRPTSTQALAHEYFADAVDPLRPKSSASRVLGRKQSDLVSRGSTPTPVVPSSKPSWFRKSLIGRTEPPELVANQAQSKESAAARPAPLQSTTQTEISAGIQRTGAGKRSTWTNGVSNMAPMPILPSIRPISPLSADVNARANLRAAEAAAGQEKSKKIGRQLSVNSSTNHYAEIHRQQAERALNGNSGLASPPSGQKEGFFSHLRKRARRLSGRHQTPSSPQYEDVEAVAGCAPWAGSNRSSITLEQQGAMYDSLDMKLRNVQNNLDTQQAQTSVPPMHQAGPSGGLKRHHSLPQQQHRSVDNLLGAARSGGPISSRTRRAQAAQGVQQYEAPAEEDELLDEVLTSTHTAMKHMNSGENSQALRQSASNLGLSNPYPTPSPSAGGNQILFGDGNEALRPKPLDLGKKPAAGQSKWPTPPYEESEWAASASASIWAAGSRF
ncbi:kinase-like domain-containing protein [Emericellopsis atlantica]|uniref:Kinase-like domain-containing protein n=1 Tax=Emericellopsis atlantica TaxID=2614577 RepID=A0A9P7ZQU1_9HYPO|nr:kinase-like domain-containing protein [Emericellopsis atlantica]KAG9256629.1 kinase-like domain-containing protein [Emericellopsis atlantica]